ncbi:MAG: pilus assembly protein [Brevundimonas sp.]|uniref:TadE/TadG family type IV pilus assembly protein n=1 Tax=Brevundimonas sp. TaxID=1871086 RepID=UPI00271DF5AE|nr:TadE/TadG family type IV pilus assembly protein [Brevundimonas sp.]MDZ4318352.1 TadE/TadG family type IV pilus assembly protein [Phenylobacterium sp.]MDO9588943.1 pilus assembly protein [Brevundimonas sp.]MDP3370318.1 pilus assembly protein [Brevundimonas sp.]MDP3655695.1 pilus assembly protein [Brevundimonas sp.]MDZ4108979.1 TadE/TadG family type IV pilus assembly protein [Brevundimonas sp.]
MIRRGLFSRLEGDERGVAAVEFAMIAPILIFFYLGMAEFCQGYMAQKRMGHASAMVADLVAQEEAVSTAGLNDIFAIGGLIMKPFSAAPLSQRVSSVTRVSGVARIDWSRGSGMDARAVNSTIVIPTDLIADGESVIVSEATYDYDSPADYLMPSLTRFSHIYYLRPRIVDKVACPTC